MAAPAIEDILATYVGAEETRVREAIRELAEGSPERAQYFLDCARRDYRDVLWWLELEHRDQAK